MSAWQLALFSVSVRKCLGADHLFRRHPSRTFLGLEFPLHLPSPRGPLLAPEHRAEVGPFATMPYRHPRSGEAGELPPAVSGLGEVVACICPLNATSLEPPNYYFYQNNSQVQSTNVNTFRSLFTASGLQSEGREEIVFLMHYCRLPTL